MHIERERVEVLWDGGAGGILCQETREGAQTVEEFGKVRWLSFQFAVDGPSPKENTCHHV